MTADIRTFIAFEELTGKKFRPGLLGENIRQFDLVNLLSIAARLGFLLSYSIVLPRFRRNAADIEQFLAHGLLGDTTLARLPIVAREWPARRAIFSRQQALALANLVLIEGSERGPEATGSPEGRVKIGEILLGINELLFTREQLRQVRNLEDDAGALAAAQQIGYLLSFYNPPELGFGLFRVDVMLSETFHKASVQALKASFAKARGLPLDIYRDLVLALMVFYLSTSPEEVIKSPDRLVVNPSAVVDGNQMPIDELKVVLAAEARTPTEAKAELAGYLHGRAFQDFSLWKRWPLMAIGAERYLCIDPGLLLDKLGGGFRWTLVNAFENPNERGGALAVFGELAEGYLDWLLRQAGDHSLGGRLLSFPSFAEGEEAFDAVILSDQHAIVFEHKVASLPARAVAGDQPAALQEQIDRVFGADGGLRFARRLESALHVDEGRRRAVIGLDFDEVTRVTPVFLTLDDFWRFRPTAKRAARAAADTIRSCGFRPGLQIDPPVIVDVDVLETLMGPLTIGALNLRECLATKVRLDPEHGTSMREFLAQHYRDSYGRVEWKSATERLKGVWNRMGQRYFGEDVWD